MDLAQELIDQIIDLLSDDTPSLLACSLVSRKWYPPCRGYIHNKFRFKGIEECARRLKFYAETPGLLACIQTLVIDYRKSGSSIPINEVLNDIDFPRVRNLTLKLGAMSCSIYAKHKTIEYIRTHLPQVTTLVVNSSLFNSFKDVVSLICAFPHLSHLALGINTFDGNGSIEDQDPSWEPCRLRLKTLEISAVAEDCNRRFLKWIQEAQAHGSNSEQRVDLRVDTITLNWGANCTSSSIAMGEVMEDICKAVCPSTRHLRMMKIQGRHEYLTNRPPEQHAGSLTSPFAQLRTLYIEVSVLEPMRTSTWIAQLISSITSPHFHKLTLKLILSKTLQLKVLCLSKLDGALDSMTQEVDEMRIVLSPCHRMSVAFKDIVGFVNKQMPRTVAKGIINFSYLDDQGI